MRTLLLALALIFFFLQEGFSQTNEMRTLTELINKQEPGWDLVKGWIKEAENKVEILPREVQRAEKELVLSQVTTRSPMGAIVYETGGILIDNGWIRILGSGSEKLNRGLIEWNLNKSFSKLGEQPSFLLIADDVIGGFFAINAGEFGKEGIGKVFYLSPDNLQWESLKIGYSDFLSFCFSGNINGFYEGLRWRNWQKDVKELYGNKGFHFYPYLFSEEGKDINKVIRKAVPIQELWNLYAEKIKNVTYSKSQITLR
ncbi:MAG: DUF2625 domain-containing protein [Adhaeribacter sp.]